MIASKPSLCFKINKNIFIITVTWKYERNNLEYNTFLIRKVDERTAVRAAFWAVGVAIPLKVNGASQVILMLSSS